MSGNTYEWQYKNHGLPAPGGPVLHTRGHWKDLGRFVLDPELNNGASIFTRSSTGRGYTLTSAYNIAPPQRKAPARSGTER